MDITTESEGDEKPGHVVVVGQWRQGHARLPLPYVAAVRNAGADAHIFSTFSIIPTEPAPPDLQVNIGLDPDDLSPLDGAVGLVLPGGGDIEPSLYGERPHPKTRGVNLRRDEFELTLLRGALERDLPVLAICHGMQMLNVALGGTLEQDLDDRPGRLKHNLPHGPDPVHQVVIQEGSELRRALGEERVPVNSSHHQGLGRVAPPLAPAAWAEDGVLEGVISREHSWVVGVQWHPELMATDHPVQQRLFETFVEATRRYADHRQLRLRSA